MEMHTHASLRAIHGLDVRPRHGVGIMGWLLKLSNRMRQARRRRRDHAALMTDRQLRDIGFTRADVVAGLLSRRSPRRQDSRG